MTTCLVFDLSLQHLIPFQIGSLLSLSPQESFSCKLLILQQCTLTMHIHYALYLAVSCTSLIAVIYSHNSILSKSLRSPLNTSTTCKLLHFHFSDVPSLSLSKPYSVMYTSLSKSTCLLHTSVMYTHYRSPLQCCTLTLEVTLVFLTNRRYG
jgi:hypothetical protein